MIGRGELPLRFAAAGEGFARLANRERRFFAIDGGNGATILSALSAPGTGLVRVWSPRHAQLLVVFEPVSNALVASILEVHRAMPRPCGMMAIGDVDAKLFREASLVRLEDLFPQLERCDSDSAPADLANRLRAMPLGFGATPAAPGFDPITLPLPDSSEREMATELVVFGLGPVQPFTAGPLRLLLVVDGEQVDSVTVEAGYANRHLQEMMTKAAFEDAERLARSIDPLAPVAGRLAYLHAIEDLARARPREEILAARQASLLLERTSNHIAWLIRFATVLSVSWLKECAERLNSHIETVSDEFDARGAEALRMAASDLASIRRRIAGDRMLGLRTRGLGVISANRLRAAGASGPAVRASERGAGDVLARMMARVEIAAEDVALLVAARESGARTWAQATRPGRVLPAGEGHGGVEGPRGRIELSLESDGVTLRRVEWTRPSASLLSLVPELLANQRLADAEAIVASLDLSMAEADG